MRRVALLASLALGVLAAPLAISAQQAGRVYRIGLLMQSYPVADTVGPNPREQLARAFLDGLRQFGYVEGQNVIIERRTAEGNLERLPALATELVRLKVDVIVVTAAAPARAAKNATTTIPIVMAGSGDPLALGLVSSLARPGGNVTGLSSVSVDLTAKRLELLKEALPKVTRVAVLTNPDSPVHLLMLKEAHTAARALRVHLLSLDAAAPDGIEQAFPRALAGHAGALLVFDDATFSLHRARIVDLAARSHLPVMYGNREYSDGGGLMSYGPNGPDIYRRVATYIDKILKGAKPADLPVEQPTKFELVVNLKTALALGLTIPQSVLVRADEIIR